MQVTPVNGNLQGAMEVGDGAVTADQKPSPDHRADAANPDVGLVDLDTVLIFAQYHEGIRKRQPAKARSS